MGAPKQMYPPVKDEAAPHPVASAWRPALKAIIRSFAAGRYSLKGIDCVEPLDEAAEARIKSNIAAYGETLAELSDETWTTSQAQWMGTHWDLIVDLWTLESGCSDLTLGARVVEEDDKFRIRVRWVHVP